MWLNLRGTILLAAAQNPTGLAVELARMLSLPSNLAALDADVVFAPPAGPVEVDLWEWVTFARARDLDRGDGLVFVPSPLDAAAPRPDVPGRVRASRSALRAEAADQVGLMMSKNAGMSMIWIP